MVRGNWQQRVEKADARKREAKEKKRKNEDKRVYKGWYGDLIALLDRHEDAIQKTIHVWTEQLPTDSPPLLDIIQDKGKRRPRSNTVESEGSARKPNKSDTKKKVHPRSKEVNASIDNDIQMPFLCRANFFRKCEAKGGKKGGCKHLHYSPPFQTLSEILQKDARDAEAALRSSITEEDEVNNPGTMEMIYHFPVHVNNLKEGAKGSALANELSSSNINGSSVVYITVGDVLVYDRFREGGVILSDLEFLEGTVGEIPRRHRFSIGSEDEVAENDIVLLTGTILEHILTFLPDRAVSSLARVCRDWNREIGSPNLWRHFLERKGWPHSQGSHDLTFHEQFVQHYSVVRDTIAIKAALDTIHHRKRVQEIEFTYQDFSSRKNRPAFPNTCVGVEVWGKGQIMAGYSQDCSLRLFETTAIAGSEKRCKELVCQRIDPYKMTKKRKCELVTFGVDEETVGSLCHVVADGIESEAYILVTMSRDNFLLGESSDAADFGTWDDPVLKIIDIGEAVLNYLICLDSVDHRLLDLMDYFEDGGEVGTVEVLVSHSMIACGDGRFMIEVAISIPIDGIGVDGSVERTYRSMGRKFVLISANAGAIIWIGDSDAVPDGLGRRDDFVLSSLRIAGVNGTRKTCYFAAAPASSASVFVGKVSHNGEVFSPAVLPASSVWRETFSTDGWLPARRYRRQVAVTDSAVIVGEIFEKSIGDGETERQILRSYLSFMPWPSQDDSAFEVCSIGEGYEVLTMTVARTSHLLVLCRTHSTHENSGLEDLDGHWFVDEQDTQDEKFAFLIFHIPTRVEIHREYFQLKLGLLQNVVPKITNACGGTLGLGYGWQGFAMTGLDIQSLGDRHVIVLDEKSSRKKKKGRGTKGGKKDGFARGMSLRG